jgi:hypothetical protein
MKEWNEVEAFKDWWMAAGCPIKPPFEYPIHITDMAYALTIYRKGQYQIELYICKPNTQTQVHAHPGIESLSVYLTGNLSFAKDGAPFPDLSAYQKEGSNGTHLLLGKSLETVNGTPHALKVNEEGGSFLLFQRWSHKKPRSVAVEYDGVTLGHKHDKQIEVANVE